VDAQVGVADSFRVGNMIFRNVVFAVFSDNDMNYASALRTINGVIGWPVISHMGTIQLKGKEMSFPVEDPVSPSRNMGLEGDLPFLNVSFYGEYHPYIFDTGSYESLLGKNFLRRFNDSITHAMETNISGGTFGQDVKMKVLRVAILPYRIETYSDELILANILEEGDVIGEDEFYGIIGSDMIYGWKVGKQTATMNFDRMYLHVE